MQAIGLRLEENGTVLALREVGEDGEKAPQAGGKWERVPDSVLRRLDNAAKVKYWWPAVLTAVSGYSFCLCAEQAGEG